MLTKLKQKTQKLLQNHAKTATKIGLTPNKITTIGITLATTSAITYTQWQTNNTYLLTAAILLLLSGYCDALDGATARLTQKTTPFGNYLDSLLDRYADAAIITAITISGLCQTHWGITALTGTLLVSYTRAKAETLQIKMETIGIAERPERLIIITTATIIAYFWQPTQTLNYATITLTILTHTTVIQRTTHTYKKLKPKNAYQNATAAHHAP
ncbi:MAG: archaetidylinositol phosphate synthase [Candidatus Bathyarchaeales archaeon]